MRADSIRVGHRADLHIGDVVSHFKRKMECYPIWSLKYLYCIIGIAEHSETNELVVIYISLETRKMYVRPLEMFTSEVDRDKYPDVRQKYRFEKYNGYLES